MSSWNFNYKNKLYLLIKYIMNLVIIWICFILLMTVSEKLDQSHYLLFSSSMLYLTYLYNRIQPIKMAPRISVSFIAIPSIIFWYIVFVYNDFLCLTPISYEYLVSLIFIYSYLMTYLFWECP
jgi:hypothetical protein